MLSLMGAMIRDAVEAEDRHRRDPHIFSQYLLSRQRGLAGMNDPTIFFDQPDDLNICEVFTTLGKPVPLTSGPRDIVAIIPRPA